MPTRFLLALVPLLALTLAACSSPCQSYCTRSNACSSGFPEACDAVCVQEEDSAAHSGCTAQYQAYASCRNDATNVCTDAPLTRCADKAAAYDTCVQAFCAVAAHATDALCRMPVP